MLVYIDSSALMKVIRVESESDAFNEFILDPKWTPICCDLIETEMRRGAQFSGIPVIEAVRAINLIDVVEIKRADFRTAGVIEARNLRSLDAIHLAVALATEADFICSYDTRMVEAALYVGIPVLRPGYEPENPT